MITASAFISGGLRAPQLASLAVVILAARLLVGRRAAIGATLASAATVLSLTAIEILETPAITDFQPVALIRSMILLGMLSGSLLVLVMALRRIEKSRIDAAEFERELQQRNPELQLARERYREISALTSEHFYSMRVGRDGEVVNELTSPHFERLTGYNASELTTQLYWEMIHPEDRARLAAR